MFNLFKKPKQAPPEEVLESDCDLLQSYFNIYQSGHIMIVDGSFLQYKRSWLSQEITIPLNEDLLGDELKSFFIEKNIKCNDLKQCAERIITNLHNDKYRTLSSSRFLFEYMYNNPTNYYIQIKILGPYKY
jgi:hypothetical protein